MKKSRYIILLILSLTLCCGVLAGCGKSAYTVSVTGGSASVNKAKPGETVTLTVDISKVPLNSSFHHWASDDVTFNADGESFVMPAKNVSIAAVYDGVYNITVIGGTAKSAAEYRETVKLTVNLADIPAGKEFDRWSASDSSVTADGHYFRMPAKDITFTAMYRDIELDEMGSYKMTYITNVEKDTLILHKFSRPNELPERPADVEMRGHTVIGWFRDEQYTKMFDFDNPVNSDMTLFAKWTITVYNDPTDTFTYGIHNNGAIVNNLTAAGMAKTEIIIPAEVEGIPVTAIGAYAFMGYKIEKATLPDTITFIGDFAFAECKSLTSLTLGNGIKEIGYSALFKCEKLGALTLPATLGTIRDRAFAGCESIEALALPDSVTHLGAYFAEGCTALAEVTIGAGVKVIPQNAFYKCGLTSVTIPATVRTIDIQAFSRCESLTSAVIEDGVTRIESGAFTSCVTLISITLSSTLEHIGDAAFSNCAVLKEIAIPGSVTYIGLMSLFNCESLTSIIVIGTSPAILGADAFGSECSIVFESQAAADIFTANEEWAVYAGQFVIGGTVE